MLLECDIFLHISNVFSSPSNSYPSLQRELSLFGVYPLLVDLFPFTSKNHKPNLLGDCPTSFVYDVYIVCYSKSAFDYLTPGVL